jgi:hypothetical protein
MMVLIMQLSAIDVAAYSKTESQICVMQEDVATQRVHSHCSRNLLPIIARPPCCYR